MQNELAVADRAFQLNQQRVFMTNTEFVGVSCVACQTTLSDWLSRHVCPQCSAPQPLSTPPLPQANYFQALGVKQCFSQDPALLQKRFYEVSRQLHPDRFTQGPPEHKSRSLERMSFVNLAYTTLKDPRRLRDYLLEIEGVKAKGSSSGIPMELAESWFELQENREDHLAWSTFERSYQDYCQDLEKAIQDAQARYDEMGSHQELEAIAALAQKENYLVSMRRDMERMKRNAHSK